MGRIFTTGSTDGIGLLDPRTLLNQGHEAVDA